MPSDIYVMSGSPAMQPSDSSSIDARMARIENIIPYQLRGNKYAGQHRNQFLPLASGGTSAGKLNLAVSNAISFQGILAPNVIDGQFSVACPSDSTATIYWDGTNSSRAFIIRRPDGTTTTVPGSNITVSGLTNSLKYQTLAYWAPQNQCGLGFAQGTQGTPQIAFLSTDSDTTFAQGKAQQSLAGREPLGNISWTQPGPGGSSGATTSLTPPSRQIGTCVMVNTLIEPAHEISPWDWKTVNHPETEWRRIITENLMSLQCTHNHPLYDEDGEQRRADWFTAGKWITTNLGLQKIADAFNFYKDCTKQQVMMKSGHLFWANGFLSHNDKLNLT